MKLAKTIWDSPLWDYAGLAVIAAFAIFRLESLHWIWVCVLLAVFLVIRSHFRRKRRQSSNAIS